MIHDTQSAQISQKQDGRNIYVIMKTMCPPGYHHNGFVATHALGHMMYGSHDVYIYIYSTLAINLLHMLHGQSSQFQKFIFALKISSDKESFIAMGAICHN